MRAVVCKGARSLGRYVGAEAAAALNIVLQDEDRPARLLLSTGQSQFESLADLVRRPVDWRRVEAFHLDEYAGLAGDHPASFRSYLRQRVADLVPLSMHYVDPGSPQALQELGALVEETPMDVALVGLGENGHIAFNDPPADFESTEPFIEVQLEQRCRAQQVHEGWFERLEEVPERAVTMSVSAILRSRKIISAVPHAAKAVAVRDLFAAEAPDPALPASALLGHPDATLVLDRASSALLPHQAWARCIVL